MPCQITEVQLWIRSDAYADMLLERADKFDYETGGILLGYRNVLEGAEHWVVTDAVGPGNSARHGKYTFIPDYEHHTKEAERHFNNSQGKEYYLGDWHTHPNASSETSWLDRMTILKNAKGANHTANRSIMVIIGGQLTFDNPTCYIGSQSQTFLGLVAKPLTLEPVSGRTNGEWLLFHGVN